MIKRIFISLCTLIFLGVASCDKEHKDETKYPIQFGVNLNNSQDSYSHENTTKGSDINNNNIANFGMFAFYEESGGFNEITSKPNFMSNVKVEKSNMQWSYSPLMYWPPLGSISFFAYAPYELTQNNGGLTISSVGVPKYTYTVNSDVTLQKDLLLSDPLIDKTNKNGDNKLIVPFKHALSGIVFNASVLTTQADPVKITEISLQSMKNKGVATFTKTTATPQSWILAWTQTTDATDNNYTLSITNSCLADLDIKDKTTATSISTTNGALMLLPQKIDTVDKIIVTVTSGIPVETRNIEISLSTLIDEFLLGNKYTFNIVIASKVDVNINCKVEPWIEKLIEVPTFG